MTTASLAWLTACTLAIAAPALGQSAKALDAGQLKPLVSGRSWAISFYGNPSEPAVTATWDFRADGTLCGRPAGSKPRDKCADEGKWALKGALLCWDLTWLGGTYGFKSACTSVSQKAPGLLELRNESHPELTFAVAKPL
jgi:hypothetical protein